MSEKTIGDTSLEKLLADMAMPADQDAPSATELRRSTGLAEKALNDYLHRLHAEGRIIVGRKTIPSFSGRSSVPTYRLVKKGAKRGD